MGRSVRNLARIGSPGAQQVEAAPAGHHHRQIEGMGVPVSRVPREQKVAESEDPQSLVGIEADSIMAGAIGAPRTGTLLDNRHVGPERAQPVKFQAERHIAVPGYDAQLDGVYPLNNSG